jgi:hypothetical protein
MKHLMVLALVGVSTTTVVAGTTVDPTETSMRRDVGKTFWILKPDNKGLEICKTSKDCRMFSDTTVSVLGVVKNPKLPFPYYKVRTRDGFEGLISLVYRDRLIDHELTAAERNRVRICEERGRPAVNSIRDEVIFCMGSPSHINKTETARGVHEQLTYRDIYVYVENDWVTAIQSHQ